MSSNHSKGKDNEEALEPEDDVIEEVHLSLVQNILLENYYIWAWCKIYNWKTIIFEPGAKYIIGTISNNRNNNNNDKDDYLKAPNKLKAGQKDGDGHDTAEDKPAFFSDDNDHYDNSHAYMHDDIW